MAKLRVYALALSESRTFTATGRDAWALLELLKAGTRGCTPIDYPGPRWSGYVFNLKRKHGLAIQTIYENHGGQFAGNHARYLLRSPVELISRSDMAEREAA